MRNLILLAGLLVVGVAHADYDEDLTAAKKMDNLNNKLYGTCTVELCSAGSLVEVNNLNKNASVLDSSGNPHSLTSLEDHKFKVIETDKVHPGLTWVQSDGERYQFQRFDLKPVK